MFGLVTVPVLYRGPWNEERIRACWTGISALRGKAVHCDDCNILPEADQQEGYVVRLADAFPYDRHAEATAKYVRKDHVQTDEFWMSQPVVPNWIGGSP